MRVYDSEKVWALRADGRARIFYSLVLCKHFSVLKLIEVDENGSDSQDERSVEDAHDSEEVNTTQNCKEKIY